MPKTMVLPMKDPTCPFLSSETVCGAYTQQLELRKPLEKANKAMFSSLNQSLPNSQVGGT